MEYYRSCAGKREKDTLRNPNSHTQSDCVTVVLLVDGLYCLIWRIVTPSTEHFVKHKNTRHKKTNKKKSRCQIHTKNVRTSKESEQISMVHNLLKLLDINYATVTMTA